MILRGLLSLMLIAGLLPINNIQINANGNSLVLGSETSVVLLHSPILVDSGITASFTGSVSRIKVTVTNGSNGDKLSAPSYSECSYSSSTYILLCEGTYTASQATAILRNVYFDSLSNDLATREIEFSVGTGIIPFEFSPGNYHYYEYVNDPVYWSDAKIAAEERTFEGMTGYLATVMSEEENAFISTKLGENAWLGGSDCYTYINAASGSEVYADQDEAEGHWYWVTGPEKGQQFSEGNDTPETLPDMYAAFAEEEPNNSGEEHFLEIYVEDQTWNDLADDSDDGYGYVVEYSGGTDVNLISLTVTKQLEIDAQIVRYYNDDSEVTGTVPVDLKLDYEVGDTVTVLGNPGSLTKANAVFLGWTDGTTTYHAGDTFTFSERIVLKPVFGVFDLTDTPMYYMKDSGNTYSIDGAFFDYLTVEKIWVSKLTIDLSNEKSGDLLSFLDDGTYTCNDDACYDSDAGEYSTYELLSTYDEDTMTLIITTDVPVSPGEITYFISNTLFDTSGDVGDRTVTVSLYSNASTVIISDSRTIRVYNGYHVTYLDDDHMTAPIDSNKYTYNEEVVTYTPSDVDYPGYRFLYWLGSDGNAYFPEWEFSIKEDLTMTAVYTSTYNSTDSIDNFLSVDPIITGFEDYINTYRSYYNNYEEWKGLLKLFELENSEVNANDLDLFLHYFSEAHPKDDHEYFLMDLQMFIIYWTEGSSIPAYDQYTYLEYGEGEGSVPITISFILPEALRGRSDYQIVRLHWSNGNSIFTEIETTYDPVTFKITFQTDRFSFYSLTYASTKDIPDTGNDANYGFMLLLASLILVWISKRKVSE